MVKTGRNRFSPAGLSLSVAFALAVVGTTPALAAAIDTGNPDITMRWDNQLRYNVGWRMEQPNPNFLNSNAYDETEGSFDRGEVVTNRFNVFSEFDFKYQRKFGFRVSASAWSEQAYDNTSTTNPLLTAAYGAIAPLSNNGPSRQHSSYAKRYVTGSSGEFSDAFVFGGFELGATSLNIKLGQHNVSWGDSLFTITDGINAGQGPIDTIKAATSTGAVEAKELFMPLNQLSMQWSLADGVSLMGQYMLDWKPFRLTPGGTFFASGSGVDGTPSGYGTGATMYAKTFVGGGTISYLDSIIPGRNQSGLGYGLGLRMTPAWLDGTVGVYYRKFDEKLPWSIIQHAPGALAPPNLAIRLSYARDTELFGVSLNKIFSKVSVGAELSMRHNTALNTVSGFFAGSNGDNPVTAAAIPAYLGSAAANMAFSQTPAYNLVEGARGNTYHAVVNGIYLLPQTALWDAGTLQGELTYQRLDKVTKNRNVFLSEGYACSFGYALASVPANKWTKDNGCSTKDALAMTVGFSPEWAQVMPGWNLKMPTSLSYGLKGNSPTTGGSYEGAYKWSIGLVATYNVVYEFGLAYADSHAKYTTVTGAAANGGVPGTQVVDTRDGSPEMNNRAWLSLYFKTSF